ncbi:response regulator [Zoogloea sp.]|uniref:ANTAR domain-containing response regulator n=1 Tax=Zoogloea sp. TaxID=49181 RepID=UPI001AD52B98|nr:response regulator [Zoogloea sp.]MBN8281726.1 response regulator [Zoogloea sp.]
MSVDTSTPGRPRILLIADDATFTTALHLGLQSEGYELTCATDTGHALALRGEAHFDLAILDEPLPCIMQHELARTLREQFQLPFIVLSSCTDGNCLQNAIIEGALAYLMKPVDVCQLIPMIATAIARGTELKALRTTCDQLQTALNQERDISIATGMVMVLLDLDRAGAFEFLRRQARSSRRKLGEVAHELIGNRGATLKT